MLALILIVSVVIIIAIILIVSKKKESKSESKIQGVDAKTKSQVPIDDTLYKKYSNDKYFALYQNNNYKQFLVLMMNEMKSGGKAPEYKEFNFPISGWLTEHSIDPMTDINGWFRWIEGFKNDDEIFQSDTPAIVVRDKADAKVRDLIDKLEKRGSFFKVDKVEQITESVFIKASVDNYVSLVLKK